MDSKSISFLILLSLEILVLVIYAIYTSKEIKSKNSTKDYLNYWISQFVLFVILPTSIIFVLTLVVYDYIPEISILIYALFWAEKYSLTKKNDPPNSLTVVPELREYYEALENVLSPFSNCELTYTIFNAAKGHLRSQLDRNHLNISHYASGRTTSDDQSYDNYMMNGFLHKKYECWATCFALFILEEEIRPSSEKATALTLYLQDRVQYIESRIPTLFLYGFRASKTIKKLYEERLEKERQ